MKFLCLQASSVWERYGGIESYLDDLAEGSDTYLTLIDEGISAAVR